jgi:hypothetical protein
VCGDGIGKRCGTGDESKHRTGVEALSRSNVR